MLRKYLSHKALQLFTHPSDGFSPAMETERIVFGARRPGYPFSRVPLALVTEWLQFMHSQGIQQVVCLLPDEQLKYYPDNLLEQYRSYFGEENVCWVPIDDFTLIDEYLLINVLLPFLLHADRQNRRVVIHCSGGIGRTGHTIAAWLVAKYGYTNQQAIATVRRMGRNAREARDMRLDAILDRCRQVFVRT